MDNQIEILIQGQGPPAHRLAVYRTSSKFNIHLQNSITGVRGKRTTLEGEKVIPRCGQAIASSRSEDSGSMELPRVPSYSTLIDI
jgi:hypothetical protein